MKLHLVPEPQRIRMTGGALHLPDPLPILRTGQHYTPWDRSALMLSNAVRSLLKARAQWVPVNTVRPPAKGAIILHAKSTGPAESYTLSITPGGVRVEGDGAPGLFYGVQTLIQIIRDRGASLPCLFIADRPALAHRGYYLDISRGKVPRMSALKALIDRLAAFKINQFQLYVEHVFEFRFDPEIGRGFGSLTAREVRDLDRYCRQRHIEFVPSLACFGHMGRILSLPKYRALAEVEWPAPDWRRATWPQRLRGATLNPLHPGSKRLLGRMLDEFLPLFSSGLFNMCGDETYDLGKGRNASRAARRGVDRLYLDHVRFLRRLARRHGKRLMFWGDVMLHHPRAIRDIPRDCVVLDWGYSPKTPFEKVGKFLRPGLSAYVCPSVRGYRVVFNDVEEARGNIAGYARAARDLGADGLLNTDWGDMGHFNMLACSYHGLVLGAAMAWNPGGDEGAGFDRAFALQFFGDRTGEVGRLYSKAGSTGISEWPYLISEPRNPAPALAAKARRLVGSIADWRRRFERMKPAAWAQPNDVRELAAACEALRLNARKLILESRRAVPASAWRAFRRDLAAFARRYERVWLARNRPSSLTELQRAFRAAVGRLPGGRP